MDKIRFEDVVRKVERFQPDADLDVLRRAYIFSAKEHANQKRASGEPYLIHPLSVADLLADMRLDVATVCTGLLHDVIEDTLTTLDELRNRIALGAETVANDRPEIEAQVDTVKAELERLSNALLGANEKPETVLRMIAEREKRLA